MSKNTHIAVKLSSRTWFVLSTLAFTELIAWAIEYNWFNSLVFDILMPDPGAETWMVDVSIITATLVTLLMGTLSYRTQTWLGWHKF